MAFGDQMRQLGVINTKDKQSRPKQEPESIGYKKLNEQFGQKGKVSNGVSFVRSAIDSVTTAKNYVDGKMQQTVQSVRTAIKQPWMLPAVLSAAISVGAPVGFYQLHQHEQKQKQDRIDRRVGKKFDAQVQKLETALFEAGVLPKSLHHPGDLTDNLPNKICIYIHDLPQIDPPIIPNDGTTLEYREYLRTKTEAFVTHVFETLKSAECEPTKVFYDGNLPHGEAYFGGVDLYNREDLHSELGRMTPKGYLTSEAKKELWGYEDIADSYFENGESLTIQSNEKEPDVAQRKIYFVLEQAPLPKSNARIKENEEYPFDEDTALISIPYQDYEKNLSEREFYQNKLVGDTTLASVTQEVLPRENVSGSYIPAEIDEVQPTVPSNLPAPKQKYAINYDYVTKELENKIVGGVIYPEWRTSHRKIPMNPYAHSITSADRRKLNAFFKTLMKTNEEVPRFMYFDAPPTVVQVDMPPMFAEGTPPEPEATLIADDSM